MSRLYTNGQETRVAHRGEHPSASLDSAAPTFNTSKQFDGTVCAEHAANAPSFSGFESSIGAGTSGFPHAAIMLDSLPSKTLMIMGAGDVVHLAIKSDGEVLMLGSAAGSFPTLLSTGYKIAADTHYLFEFKLNVSAGGEDTYACRVLSATGEVLYASGDKTAAITTEPQFFWWEGQAVASGTSYEGGGDTITWCSHYILNDSNGADQNSYPGYLKVVMLKPVSDNTRDAGWLDGNSGTSNLFESLNNAPPTGISGSTNGTKIKNAVSTTTEKYRANLQSYTEAGIGSEDVIKTCQGLFRVANSTSTARSLGVSLISNPAISEALQSTEGTVGTEPTGWKTGVTGQSYSPSVTKGTQPVLNIKKNAASTNTVAADLAGMYVSYEPAAAPPPSDTRRRMVISA